MGTNLVSGTKDNSLIAWAAEGGDTAWCGRHHRWI